MIWRGGPSILVPAKARDAAPIYHTRVRMSHVMRARIHTGTTAGTVLPHGARGGGRLRGREHSTALVSQPPSRLGLGGVYALLHSGHAIGDYWVQTRTCAAAKSRDGWTGQRACAIHVVTLTATQGVFLAAGALAVGTRLNSRRVVAGLAVNAVSHYWADRRTPLRRLAERLGEGKFYGLGQPRPGHDDNPCLGTGAYALDQAWHIGWLAVAAAIIAGD
ncbi:hypothetical protein ACRYCC_26405 [Actinomadura scrupuli]|uniref:hypothetical protein n=1 Tax=Actinomadura scrupuli TaxID=559629 RepID=UPI003D9592AB